MDGVVCIVHPRDSKIGVRIIADHGERAGIFTHIGVEDTVIFVALLVAHFKRDLQFLVLWQEHSIVGRLRFFAVILRGKRLWGAGSPAPRSTALCTLRGACLLAFHGAGLRALCRARPCTLREVRHLSIGAHADSVVLVRLEIFGRNGHSRVLSAGLNGVSAHGQRHVDGVIQLPIFGFFEVIAKAGVLPLVAVFLIDRHAVAVGVVHLIPCSLHHLVADKGQRNVCRSSRLIAVRVVHRGVRLPAVDGGKGVHSFARSVLGDLNALFRH